MQLMGGKKNLQIPKAFDNNYFDMANEPDIISLFVQLCKRRRV
jgi:hypothetical protein